jgi:uncharacterized SAM-binding protein YcdF (DUF218 family)
MGPEGEYTPGPEDLEEEPELEPNELYANCVVLGSGFRGDKPGSLNLESKIRALAAGELASEGDVKKLIFTGGVIQKGSPTIASAMREYMLAKYPDLADFPIELEEQSIDTIEDAENVAAMLREQGSESAVVLTSESHLPRSLEAFGRNGIAVDGLVAELLASERSPHHLELMDKYRKSLRSRKDIAVETILRGISRTELGRKLLNEQAHRSRDQ